MIDQGRTHHWRSHSAPHVKVFLIFRRTPEKADKLNTVETRNYII
jgi:hypothetical protein